MAYQLLKKSKVDFNPCEVEYSRRYNVFVVGTYQLVEEDSELFALYSEKDLTAINSRVGSLNVFTIENVCLEQHKCRFGGVFALKISSVGLPQSKSELILAAHANGVIGLYQLLDMKITLYRYFETNSTMLTTIDEYMENESNKWTIWTGASDGRLSCILSTDSGIFNEEIKETEPERVEKVVSPDPIWFVKVIGCRIGPLEKHQTLAFVGSEDSKWRVFILRSGEFRMLHQDASAKAGVTSFEVFQQKFSSDHFDVTLLSGSYDEHLRIYKLRFELLKEEICLSECQVIKRIHIAGGGVWRLKVLHDSLLLSAMYSGAYIVKLTTSGMEYQHNLIKLDNDQTDTDSNLIYGIAGNDDLSVIAFTSFYAKDIYLINKVSCIE